MSSSDTSSLRPSTLVIVACACLLVAGTCAATLARQQQPPPEAPPKPSRRTTLGISQFKQGRTDAAIETLREALAHDEYDADAWYYLGRAYSERGEPTPAGDAYKRAVELRPALADAHVEVAYGLLLRSAHARALAEAEQARSLGAADAPRLHYIVARAQWLKCPAAEKAHCRTAALEEIGRALALDSSYAPAQLFKGHLLWEQDPAAAAVSLEAYLRAAPDDLDAPVWREQLKLLRGVNAGEEGPAAGAAQAVFKSGEVSQKAKMVSRPEPLYTEEARKAGVAGSVTLTAVFGPDGEISQIRVMEYLSHGLTARAVEALRKIKFEPPMKDGRPVSQYLTVQYHFNIY